MLRILMLITLVLVALLFTGAIYTRFQIVEIEKRFPPVGVLDTIEGRVVHYVDVPAADGAQDLAPIVFIHGASGNLRDQMNAFRPVLEGKARLIFIDRPGQGYTQRLGIADAHPSTQAKVVSDLLDKLGIEKAVISGHSLGGAIAAAFAVNYPNKTHGLMFLAPATHVWPGGVTYYYDLGAAPVAGWILTESVFLPAGQLQMQSGAQSVFDPNPMPNDYIENTGAELVLRPDSFRANAEDVTRLKSAVRDLSKRYPKIRVPTIVITGDMDDVVLARIHSVGLERDIDGAELTVLEEVGHKPEYVRTQFIADKLLQLAR